MITLLLPCSANLQPARLAAQLHRPPLVTARSDRNLPGILADLWEETASRARRPVRPWESPDGPPWIEGALKDFGQHLTQAFAARGSHLILCHESLATHLSVAARILPNTQQLMLVRDGRLTPTPIDPQHMLDGLRWARTWADSISPAADAGVDRVPVEALTTETLAETLLEPLGTQHWPTLPPLTGAALQGFACWAPARLAMAQAGYGTLEAPVMTAPPLPIIEALAMGEAMEGRPEAAVTRLRDALHRQEDGNLLTTLGDILADQGDAREACRAWDAAIRCGGPERAWVSLLAHPHQPESLRQIRAACAHAAPTVRAAAARWLVARGMDEESAEAITQIRHERWYAQPAGTRANPSGEPL